MKNNTSSKKADVPPPSANPARANKNRPKPTGNEAAFRDRTAGRKNNKVRDAPDATAPKKSNASRRATDRHSRSGKVDTDKKVRQGWGDDNKELADEAAAERDAQAEIAADQTEEQAPASNKKSLQDYLNEINNNEFNKAPAPKQVEKFDDAELLVKTEEVFAEPTKVKNLKSKQLKTKQFLEFDVSFSDSKPKPRKFDNGPRRGGKPKASKNTNTAEKKPAVNAKNFPSLA